MISKYWMGNAIAAALFACVVIAAAGYAFAQQSAIAKWNPRPAADHAVAVTANADNTETDRPRRLSLSVVDETHGEVGFVGVR